MAKQNKPAIRFKEFTDAWEQRKAKDLCSISTGKSNTQDRVDDGIYPFYVRSPIVEHSNRYLFDEEAVLTVGDGVGTGKVFHYVNGKYDLHQRVYRMFDFSEEITAKYFYYYFSNHFYDRVMAMTAKTSVDSVRYEMIADMDIALPKVKEQMAISAYFDRLDHLITLHQRKYDKLQVLKKAMLEKMFPKNSSGVPEIRFKGFTDAWEQRKLGDMMNVTSVKRIHQSDWTDCGIRFLRARDIVSAYKNEEPGDYLYISKEKYDEYSSISGKVSTGDMLVTGVGTIGVPYLVENSDPLYFKDGNIIWFQNEDKVFGKFLFYSFTGKSIQDFITESAGIGTVGTYTIESGKKTPIALPDKEEQERIGLFFANLDNLITLHQRELEKLQNIKKSMLEKMFV